MRMWILSLSLVLSVSSFGAFDGLASAVMSAAATAPTAPPVAPTVVPTPAGPTFAEVLANECDFSRGTAARSSTAPAPASFAPRSTGISGTHSY